MKVAQDFMVEIPVLRFSDQITKARQILRDDRFREVYVVDEAKKLLGFIDITDGLRVTATKSNVTIEGFIKDAPRVYAADPIERVAKEIRKFRTDSAAVVNEQRQVTGGVLLSDLFPVIISRHELHGTVVDYMTRRVVTAEPSDSVRHIYTLIVESGYSAFPVVKKKKIIGIVSRRDLLKGGRTRAAIAHAAHTTVGDIMTKEVIMIRPDETINLAAELLVRHDISRLPVISGDALAGIVDRHDIIAAIR